jgi:ribosome-associated translation inhibitor RaiA
VKGININMTKKLQRQIEKKLEKLSQLLDNIDEVRVIEPTDPDT